MVGGGGTGVEVCVCVCVSNVWVQAEINEALSVSQLHDCGSTAHLSVLLQVS